MCKAEIETKMHDQRDVKSEENIPFIANAWRSIYSSVPKIYLPFSKTIDISFMVLSAFFMCGVRILLEKVQINTFGWPSSSDKIEVTHEGASILAAIVHSSILLPGLYSALSSQPYSPSEKLSVAPSWWKDVVSALLQFCTGYMIYDMIYGIILTKWDKEQNMPILDSSDHMYLGHHFATVFYMTSTRILAAGHQSAMMCMFLGECTNPVFNTYGLIQLIKRENLTCCVGGQFSMMVSKIVDFAFPFSFFTMRTIIGPTVCAHMTYNLLFSQNARQYIPIVLRLLFVLMIWGVIFGSIPWVKECWTLMQPYLGIATAPEL